MLFGFGYKSEFSRVLNETRVILLGIFSYEKVVLFPIFLGFEFGTRLRLQLFLGKNWEV